jgi:thiamine-phosphate pyrophosphorylase
MDHAIAGETRAVWFLQFFYISFTCDVFWVLFYDEIAMQLPRFYPILDVATVTGRGWDVVEVADQILGAGAEILQFRHKGHFSRRVFEDLHRVAELCRAAKAVFVVNDRVDIARVVGAWVHLGQEDLLPSEARAIAGANAVIGYSTHNESQLRAAIGEPADYLALGPIFGTASKENPDPVVGVEELRRLRAISDRPVVAIGGITRSNARRAIEAGADSVAVIGDLYPENGDVGERVGEWVRVLL